MGLAEYGERPAGCDIVPDRVSPKARATDRLMRLERQCKLHKLWAGVESVRCALGGDVEPERANMPQRARQCTQGLVNLLESGSAFCVCIFVALGVYLVEWCGRAAMEDNSVVHAWQHDCADP